MLTKGKAPAFQFYASDFLTGTSIMTLEERGAYVTLLSLQWDAGAIPGDNLTAIGRGLGVSRRKAATLWVVIGGKFTRGADGLWRNDRLEQERRKQADYRQTQSTKGKASADARKEQPKSNRGSTAVATAVTTAAQPEGQPKGNRKSNQTATERATEGQPKSNSSVFSLQDSIERNTETSNLSDGSRLWLKVIENAKISHHNREHFFAAATVHRYQPGHMLTVEAPSAVVMEYLGKHFTIVINEQLEQLDPGCRFQVVYRPMKAAS